MKTRAFLARTLVPVTLVAGLAAGCSSASAQSTLGQEKAAVSTLQVLVNQYEGKVSTEQANIAAHNPTVHGCTTDGDLAKINGCSLAPPTSRQLSADEAQERKDAATLRNDQLQLQAAEQHLKMDEG